MRAYRLKVGILNPARAVGQGGYFQYMRALTEGLSRHQDLHISVFYEDSGARPAPESLPPNVTSVALPEERSRVVKGIRAALTLANVRSPVLGRYRALQGCDLDCLISCSSSVGFHLGIPFVGVIFDVIYRYFPHLVDFRLPERIRRDLANGRLVRHAARIVTDSEAGKRDVVRLFGADPARTRPIPLSPSPHVYSHLDLPESALREVACRYTLPERFILYPAQLWEHKNHRRLFEALVELKHSHGMVVPCVLAGSGGDHARQVLRAIPELGLEGQVIHLGYVPDADLSAVYRLATALVYASFADYTNMPVLAAMLLQTPVVCSSAFAMPEQVGDAGLLFDPFDVGDIARQIRRIWSDARLRADLVLRGATRVEEMSLDNFGRRWRDVVDEAVSTSSIR